MPLGGGRDETFKDGELHRIQPEIDWPTDEWVEVRIVREDAQEGRLVVYLNGEKVFSDVIGAFKGQSRAKAELWIGGYATQAQSFDVQIKSIVVVRRKR